MEVIGSPGGSGALSYDSASNTFGGSPAAEVAPSVPDGGGLEGWAPCNQEGPLSGLDAIGDATCSWTFTPGLQNPCDPSTQSCSPPPICSSTAALTANTNTATAKAAAAATTCKPTANAGPPQTVTEGDTVTLDGSKSTGDMPLTYSWIQTAGPAVTLTGDDPTHSSPTRQFVADPKVFAPMKDTEKKVTFRLVVTDAHGVPSDPNDPHATVDITVEPLKIRTNVLWLSSNSNSYSYCNMTRH